MRSHVTDTYWVHLQTANIWLVFQYILNSTICLLWHLNGVFETFRINVECEIFSKLILIPWAQYLTIMIRFCHVALVQGEPNQKLHHHFTTGNWFKFLEDTNIEHEAIALWMSRLMEGHQYFCCMCHKVPNIPGWPLPGIVWAHLTTRSRSTKARKPNGEG